MRALSKLTLRFRSLLRRESVDHELDAELRFHLDRQIAANIAAGMPPDEARHAARRQFGGVDQIREECRDMRKVNWLQDLAQDIRYGVRVLAKSPGFATIAILTLALGIGANTAIFSVVYAVLLKPLPFPDPSQLVFLFEAKPQEGIPSAGISYDNLTEIRAQNHAFTQLAGLTTHELTLTGRGEPAAIDIAGVTPELFGVLGDTPLIGRTFLPEDGNQGAAPVAILSENQWRSRFASDPNVIGSSIDLDHRSFTIVGVMPSEPGILFTPRSIQAWIPLARDPLFGAWIPKQGLRFLGVVGRLKPGTPVAVAQAEMDTVAMRLAKKFPAENSGWVIRLRPLQQAIVGNVRTALLVLVGAVALVLLIACANISNLLLARATSRAREISLRIALGAGRARIVRQLLTESAILGLLGGTAGVLVAYWGTHALISFLPANIPQVHAIHVDASVLCFALLLSIVASFVFGLAPALCAASSNLHTSLKEDAGRSGEGGTPRLARSFLAVAEVALAMVLLVAAGLLVRSFSTLTAVNPGFDATHVVTAEIQLPRFQYSAPEQWSAFGDELLRRLQSQPGMRDTAIGIPLPLNSQGSAPVPFEIVGHAALQKGTPEIADYVAVSPDYFRVMEIPLLRGRLFTQQDNSSMPRLTIINEAFAHQFFANEDPIGKQLNFSFRPNPGVPRQIVGVVGDVRDVSLSQDPGPMMYVPFDQAPLWGAEVVVRSNLSPGAIAATIRHEVDQIDKDLPVTGVVSMSDLLGASVAQPRFRTWLLGLFGVMALVLAAAGIFGVISYSVSRRVHEIGIRVTLGATPSDVLRLIMGETAKLIFIGLVVGIAASLALARFLSTLLFTVRATDPLTFGVVAALLALVGLAASYIPTRRAMRVDPLVALRHE
jgi:predicted permease